MPAFAAHKGPAVSIIQDQDVNIVDVDKADLTITLIGIVEQDGSKHVTDVTVSSQICRQSRFLRPLIDLSEDATELTLGGETNKHGQEEGVSREGLIVMLAQMHGLTEQRMDQLGLYSISVLGVWFALAYVERELQGSAKDALKSWFERWYTTSMKKTELDVVSARGLALPCQLFDHAVGFARVTKWLAYNHIGHVKEIPPKGFKGRDLHLPPSEFVG